jgi:tetratricopeptide (TPR) repeat protein
MRILLALALLALFRARPDARRRLRSPRGHPGAFAGPAYRCKPERLRSDRQDRQDSGSHGTVPGRSPSEPVARRIAAQTADRQLAAEFQEKLAKHPDDPRYIYLYARALVGKDTPAAIQSLQKAIPQDPQLPWTYLALTWIYSSAAFRDSAKVAENLRAYHKACPANLDAFAHLNVIEDERALRELAGALRTQLQSATARGNCATTPRCGPLSSA